MMAMNKWVIYVGALAAAMSIGRPAAAEVISAGQNGFEIRETVHVAAAPDKAYAALLQPAHGGPFKDWASTAR
jgi:hypothetical protein